VFPGHVARLSHGFEFLGYRFEAGQRWVRKKSLMGLRDKIRALTKRRFDREHPAWLHFMTRRNALFAKTFARSGAFF